MSDPAVIEELRLNKFKSFYDAAFPLRDLTLLIGRNGSGKSNIVDAVEVLSKLALGEDLRDSIDGGRREGATVTSALGRSSRSESSRLRIAFSWMARMPSVLRGGSWRIRERSGCSSCAHVASVSGRWRWKTSRGR